MTPNYDRLVAMGIEARELKDASQWAIGDIGTEVLFDATDEKLTNTEFAKDIGISRPSFVEYVSMAKFYPRVARATPNLSYSHYRMAWRKNKEDRYTAMDLLKEANDKEWTCDQMARELAIRAGKPEPIDTTLWQAYNQLAESFGRETDVRLIIKGDGAFHLKKRNV